MIRHWKRALAVVAVTVCSVLTVSATTPAEAVGPCNTVECWTGHPM